MLGPAKTFVAQTSPKKKKKRKTTTKNKKRQQGDTHTECEKEMLCLTVNSSRRATQPRPEGT